MLATWFFFAPHMVWICSVNNCSAVTVDLPFLAPIWDSGRSLYSSSAADNLFANMASSNFPMVLSKAIGRYALTA